MTKNLRFSGARLARNDNALVLTISLHIRVRIVTNCENVRRQFANFPLFIQFDLIGCINRQNLVWIYSYQNGTGVRLQWQMGKFLKFPKELGEVSVYVRIKTRRT